MRVSIFFFAVLFAGPFFCSFLFVKMMMGKRNDGEWWPLLFILGIASRSVPHGHHTFVSAPRTKQTNGRTYQVLFFSFLLSGFLVK